MLKGRKTRPIFVFPTKRFDVPTPFSPGIHQVGAAFMPEDRPGMNMDPQIKALAALNVVAPATSRIHANQSHEGRVQTVGEFGRQCDVEEAELPTLVSGPSNSVPLDCFHVSTLDSRLATSNSPGPAPHTPCSAPSVPATCSMVNSGTVVGSPTHAGASSGKGPRLQGG